MFWPTKKEFRDLKYDLTEEEWGDWGHPRRTYKVDRLTKEWLKMKGKIRSTDRWLEAQMEVNKSAELRDKELEWRIRALEELSRRDK